jgi:hypothetical protein
VSEEYDFEPVPGLPAHLPEGEQLLWQGSPSVKATAFEVLHVGWVAAYFAALLGWRLVAGLSDGQALSQIAIDSIPLAGMAVAAISILSVLARLIARTTIYTITSRRVVMRYGVALPMSVNVPFKAIQSADVAIRRDGAGDIALQVDDLGRLSYFHLWPNTRAWFVRKPQPSLRALPDAQKVATLLSRALNAFAGTPDKAVWPMGATRPANAPPRGEAAPAAA